MNYWYAATWMDLQNIMLGELDIMYYMILFFMECP